MEADHYKPGKKRPSNVYAVQKAGHGRPYPDDPDKPRGSSHSKDDDDSKDDDYRTGGWHTSDYDSRRGGRWDTVKEVFKRIVLPVAVADGVNYGLHRADDLEAVTWAHGTGVLEHIDKVPELWRGWETFFANADIWFANHHVISAVSYIGWAVASLYLTNKFLIKDA